MHYRLQQELVELTQELIRIPSCHSRPLEIHRCAQFITHWFNKQSIEAQLTTHCDIPAITVLPTPATCPILLLSHFDVVEAEHEDQFTPHISDGKLFGRGSIDDKYAVAMSMLLFREHLRHKQAQNFNL